MAFTLAAGSEFGDNQPARACSSAISFPCISTVPSSVDGALTILLARHHSAFRGIAELVTRILDFAYAPHVSSVPDRPLPSMIQMNPAFREDIYASRCESYLAGIRAAISTIQAMGTNALPSELVFFTGMPEEPVDSEDSDADIGEQWTSRLLTFDGYFKIEDRVHTEGFPPRAKSCGTDFWCTARCTHRSQGTQQFEARTWLIVQRGPEYAEPHAFFKPPSSAKYFKLIWTEGSEMEVSEFHICQLLASVSGDDQLVSPLYGLGTSLLQVSRDFQIPHSMMQLIDGSKAFPMFGEVHLGTHYGNQDTAQQSENRVIDHGEDNEFDTARSTAKVSFEPICLLRFSRHPRDLEHRIHEGPELEFVRARLEHAGLDTRLPSGAAMLVHPHQYAAAIRATCQMSLQTNHIVVSEEYLPLVQEVVNSIASTRVVRVGSAQMLGYVDGHGGFLLVERTFFNIPWFPFPLHPPEAVQLTTGSRGCRLHVWW